MWLQQVRVEPRVPEAHKDPVLPARAEEPAAAAATVDDVGGDVQVQETLLQQRWRR